MNNNMSINNGSTVHFIPSNLNKEMTKLRQLNWKDRGEGHNSLYIALQNPGYTANVTLKDGSSSVVELNRGEYGGENASIYILDKKTNTWVSFPQRWAEKYLLA